MNIPTSSLTIKNHLISLIQGRKNFPRISYRLNFKRQLRVASILHVGYIERTSVSIADNEVIHEINKMKIYDVFIAHYSHNGS